MTCTKLKTECYKDSAYGITSLSETSEIMKEISRNRLHLIQFEFCHHGQVGSTDHTGGMKSQTAFRNMICCHLWRVRALILPLPVFL
jgi:hypothetical protein